ncbi:N-acetylglucosamine-6-phosphate deacetylase [Roseimaritima multifibrata]|uniref:N-acetylglucosamine-6-phosphate deacetylase n=1 Tax=Roseimaritima multifibrata TaxID=1930274 RepID=A0A517MNE9_9BACT|nr:N-acetylglucosamine-6-phosphate deacetylase [Roseimaritima multifibrata]QDS96405.1 N-acetylglucosamine-6-phosphate deacetylase [Roseimaritima multifibrata]
MSSEGFVDLQVNGYAGIDFNDADITGEDLLHASQAMRQDGVQRFLPTVITDSVPLMEQRIKNLAELASQNPVTREMVAGFHVEGPFLNQSPGFIGAHPPQHSQLASVDVAKRLLAAAEGQVRIWTLAPECDPQSATTAFLADQGVLVSAGHCDPSLDQLKESIDAGLKLFTHLGNGCPMQMHRHDNIVQRVLSLADRLQIGLIADGHHIPLFALQNYLQLIPKDNVWITTDAIAAAGLGPGVYRLAGRDVRVAEGDAPRFDGSGNLAGSAATMPGMIENLKSIGIDSETIQAYCGGNASRLLDATN